MENFYNYVIQNYTLSGEACRILDNIVQWTSFHYEDGELLSDEGIHFIDSILSDAIGIEKQEIIDNWYY